MGKRGPQPSEKTMRKTWSFRVTESQLARINEGNPDFWRDAIDSLSIFKTLIDAGLITRDDAISKVGSAFWDLCQEYAEKAKVTDAQPTP